jgi:RimJ/RimL family protein N-acetyltransferase
MNRTPIDPGLVLRTERLVLRPLEPADADLLWPATSDPRVSRYMAWETHTDPSQTGRFLESELVRRREGRGVTWGIFLDGAFCGIVSLIALIRSHRALTYNKAELAYWLSPAYQSRGIATEAAFSVLEFGFGEFGLHKIVVGHFTVNEVSERLIKRLGFRYVGEQVEEFQKGGDWHNQKTYELLDREFKARRATPH